MAAAKSAATLAAGPSSGANATAGLVGRPIVSLEPVCVRNTFIDIPVPRSASLDDLEQLFRSRSWPMCKMLDVQALDASAYTYARDRAPRESGSGLASVDATGRRRSVALVSTRVEWQSRPWRRLAPVCAPNRCQPRPSLDSKPRQRRNASSESRTEGVVGGCTVEPEPEPLALRVLPSIGSAIHYLGTTSYYAFEGGPVSAPPCRPCAFLHTRGCESGAKCEFCHVCGPDARKMRKKQKRAYYGAKEAEERKKREKHEERSLAAEDVGKAEGHHEDAAPVPLEDLATT